MTGRLSSLRVSHVAIPIAALLLFIVGLAVHPSNAVLVAFGVVLALGLPNAAIVLLALTVAVSTLTIVQGRAILLQGVAHLAIFGAFIVLAFNP